VDILDGAEGFLPELELDTRVELGETGIEVVLEGIGVGEVDGVGLVGVFCDIREVETEGLAETSEFDFALVF